MGLIYYELNEFELAKECYMSVLLRNDNDPKVWNNLGVVFFNEKKFEEARNCFEKSISLCPQFYDAMINLRDTCRELGDFRAAAEFERILSGL
jgi:tetratricopeptide (TPR) repeat protein